MDQNPCYKACNTKWPATSPSMRLYCKKGCDADDMDSM